MKLRHFIFPVMALLGLMNPAQGISHPEMRITMPVQTQKLQELQLFSGSNQWNRPDPPPWLRPNQRQRRLARRRRDAAGDRFAFA